MRGRGQCILYEDTVVPTPAMEESRMSTMQDPKGARAVRHLKQARRFKKLADNLMRISRPFQDGCIAKHAANIEDSIRIWKQLQAAAEQGDEYEKEVVRRIGNSERAATHTMLRPMMENQAKKHQQAHAETIKEIKQERQENVWHA